MDRPAQRSMTEIAIRATSMGPHAQPPTGTTVLRGTTTGRLVLPPTATTVLRGTTTALLVHPTTVTAVHGMIPTMRLHGATNLHLLGRRLLSRLPAHPMAGAADQATVVEVAKGPDKLEWQ
jgi:hypothetical protein